MEQFMKVNGYSNSYWGWGGEDDDLGKRIISKGYSIERPDSVQGAMTMIRHVQREATQPKLVLSLVSNATLRMTKDGLNNPETWRVLQVQILPLYHYLLVNVGKPPVEWFRSTNKTLQNKDGDVYDYNGDEDAISSPPMDTKKTATSKFENYDYMD
uniref:Galactosyltransferase C-terminal domain-containing protein n=1 Tax=Plectus sambesii TaxID=2011161 RepID=A0A914W5U0_9BILA